ncbi:MAG: tRNA (N(6)-L-threonylcarbamoyladenosine(37)-C(2))-methylthiotransferase [Methanobacteriaceae archaeon]
MKVFIETYGCTFNQADSQIMAGNLKEELGADVDFVNTIEDADVAIVNTCYVKSPTENKVVNKIQKLQKDFPELKIIVSGCMVEIDPEKLEKVAPNASWIGPHQLNKTSSVVKSTFNGEIARECGFSSDSKVGVSKIRFDNHIHIIQICEGCLGTCTYCCTRFARGYLQSYPMADIVDEARQAINDGCVEIQLTAQDTAAFGKDTGEYLSNLIKEIASLDGDFRIRIGMMHPKNVIDDIDNLIDAFNQEKVYKFLHLPIQSGSDEVLAHMRRDHSVKLYKDIVSKFKSVIPNLTLATDIIVAYPSETKEDFQKTVDLLEEIKPGIIHLSKYKHRKGADSSLMDEIPYKELKKRSKYINNVKSKITAEENTKLLGSIQKALIVEKGSKGGFIAKTEAYLPVVVEYGEIGTFVNIKINETTSTYLKGTVVD